jgi:hypothetical protein
MTRAGTIPFGEALGIIESLPDAIPRPLAISFDYANPETTDGETKQRRKSIKWTSDEQEFVFNGYCRFGPLWTEILKEYPFHPRRTHTDLHDKWTNIARHATKPECARLFENTTGGGAARDRLWQAPDTIPETLPLFPLLQHIQAEIARCTENEG